MSNILVAGGCGFIGSHLIDSLLALGHSVVSADKLIMGDGNIVHLKDNELFTFEEVELSDQDAVDRLFKKHSFDAVYHLAANSDIQKGGKEPSIDFNDTLLTTRTILESMRWHNVPNLFFASTSAVYGEKVDEVLTETTGDLRPVSFYGGCKLASEAMISSYVSMCDMKAVIFRFPNVIGPRLTHGAVFDFIRKLRADSSTLEILGDGTQCKPYIYVKDLVDAIMMLTGEFLTSVPSRESDVCASSKVSAAVTDESSEKPSIGTADKTSKATSGTEVIYNISVESGGTTVTRIAEIVVEEMGLSNVKFKYTGDDRGWKGDVPRFEYDISKVLSTGWKPHFTSDEAVRQTVKDAIAAGM